jgi:hypothetical protein
MSLALGCFGVFMPNAHRRDKTLLIAVNAQLVAVVSRRPDVDIGYILVFEHCSGVIANLVQRNGGACAIDDPLIY